MYAVLFECYLVVQSLLVCNSCNHLLNARWPLTNDNAGHSILDIASLHNPDDFLPQNIRRTQEETRDELFDLQKTH